MIIKEASKQNCIKNKFNVCLLKLGPESRMKKNTTKKESFVLKRSLTIKGIFMNQKSENFISKLNLLKVRMSVLYLK